MNPRSAKIATQQGCYPQPSANGLQPAWCDLLQLLGLLVAAHVLGFVSLVVAVAVVAVLAWLLLRQQSTLGRERCTSQQGICAAGGTPHCAEPATGLSPPKPSARLLTAVCTRSWLRLVTWPLGSGASTAPWRRLGHARTSRCSTICARGQHQPVRTQVDKRERSLLQACRWWAFWCQQTQWGHGAANCGAGQ